MGKYAGSYTNLNAMDSKNGGGDAYRSKYAGKYLPADVKNWSDQQDVSDAFAKKYGGSYINLNAMDSKNGGGDASRSKYASNYLPADVKNWSDRQDVSDAFAKKYGGSYIDLNAMDSQKSGGDAYRSKYAGKYLPADVKNWSDQQEVRDVFTKKYAGSSIDLNVVSSEQHAGSHAADADVPPVSLAASNGPAETHASTVTASREAADTNAAIELVSIPEKGTQTAPHASLIIAAIAATLIVFTIFIVPSARKSRQHPVLDPLLD